MINIERDKALGPLTTMQIGGKASYFVEVFDEIGLAQAVEFAASEELPIFVLGGGSNVVISEQGFKGLVICNKISGMQVDETTGLVAAGAGEDWDALVVSAVNADLAGVECLSGIPGSVGGAVVQNIGAYGQTLSDVIRKAKVYNVKKFKFEEFDPKQCQFSYRNSLFKSKPGNYILVYALLQLNKKGKPEVSYQDLIDRFEGKNPTLSEVRDAVIKIRAGKGMVILPEYEVFRSAGSFFKNPVIEKMHFDKILPGLKPGSPQTPWYWDQKDGRVKISGGLLINQSGYEKGYIQGNVGISPKNNLAIINLGQAKASEIRNFAQEIKQKVYEKYGIELEEEILYVGSF